MTCRELINFLSNSPSDVSFGLFSFGLFSFVLAAFCWQVEMLDLVGNSWNLGESYYQVVRILAEDPSIINLNEYRRFACLTTRRIEDELGLAVLFS